MSEGGTDAFALALKLTTSGAEQMESSLAAIDAKGTQAAGALSALAGVAAAAAAAFVLLEKASAFLGTSISVAQEEEQVYVRMGVAVSNAGTSFETARPQVDALLESLSEKSTFRVDQLGGAFTRLVQLTGNTGASMKMLGAVTDFAAGRNIDLESAANLVGRAMNGNAIMLNRMLGLHGNAAEALKTLTERYHGNAEALADVSSTTLASNAMHDLMEVIGGVILHEGGAKDATLSWRDTLKEATRWVEDHREAIGNVVLTIISFGEAVGEIIATVMVPLEGLWILVNVAIYAFIDVVQTIGPVFKLAAGIVLQDAVEMLHGVTMLVPGLERLLGGVLKSVGATAKQMVHDSTTALQANDSAFLDNVAALYKVDAVTNDYILKHKDIQKTVPMTTEAIEKELAALASLNDMHVITAEQIGRLRDLYAQLETRIAAGKMPVEALEKAYKALAAAQEIPMKLLGANIAIDTPKLGPGLDKMQHDLNIEIGGALKKAQKDSDKHWKDYGEAFQASAEGQLMKANEDIKKTVDGQIKSDWEQMGFNIAGTITDAIAAGFSGGFGSALKTAEAGLGSIFTMMGKHMLMAAPPLKALEAAMKNPLTASYAVAAAGLVMIALGAALSSAAGGGSGGGGGGGGGSYSVAGAGTATNAAQVTNIQLTQNSAAAAAKLSPLSIVQPIIIGDNDPSIHQPIINIINNATSRGMTLNGATG